ncbi:ParB/RepB/Spo0J family partition protein [Endozoicomonas sp. SM1973]|uniref:ParB/RepB/Spo0J family partition protein n=1 Tax=Spartinivicinus marinus TaxID=2994442 RepID=A0A853IEB4_9GAMM|nr:ParB/RepB/Spo0J family partition protein [Spartinivicinus marinus]MCX4030204.1 ParB/RepB/Spo0J family partition protein [Spartinivicinus marinus]NYZ67847.1 ParB/RepB/Spo0J family partition protein [Spartinivicinus marinus]
MSGISSLHDLKELSGKAKSDSTSGKFLKVPTNQLEPKDQVRKNFKNIDKLGQTIEEEGFIQPIIVSPLNERGKYTIQKGERRWRAACLKKINEVDIIIKERPDSELDETAGELIENIQRENLTPLEIANALNKFKSEGWKQKRIAERIGKTERYVSSHLALLNIPECIKNLHDEEVTTDIEILNSLRQIYDYDIKTCKELCKKAVENGITRSICRSTLKQLKSPISNNSETSYKKTSALTNGSAEKSTQADEEKFDNTSLSINIPNEPSEMMSKDAKSIFEQNKSSSENYKQGWKAVDSNKQKIIVTVNEELTALLLKDRIDEDKNFGWVEELNTKKIRRVRLSELTIKEISI